MALIAMAPLAFVWLNDTFIRHKPPREPPAPPREFRDQLSRRKQGPVKDSTLFPQASAGDSHSFCAH